MQSLQTARFSASLLRVLEGQLGLPRESWPVGVLSSRLPKTEPRTSEAVSPPSLPSPGLDHS